MCLNICAQTGLMLCRCYIWIVIIYDMCVLMNVSIISQSATDILRECTMSHIITNHLNHFISALQNDMHDS